MIWTVVKLGAGHRRPIQGHTDSKAISYASWGGGEATQVHRVQGNSYNTHRSSVKDYSLTLL
jgi:hypothetical protein